MKNSKKWNTLPFHSTVHSPFLLCIFSKSFQPKITDIFIFILNNKYALSCTLTEHGCKAACLTPYMLRTMHQQYTNDLIKSTEHFQNQYFFFNVQVTTFNI